MRYELRLVVFDDFGETVVKTWDIPQIIGDKEGQVKKVKFLPALSRIKRAIRKDVAKGM